MQQEDLLPPLTPETGFPAAEKRTMYFIGMTTHQSSIMRVFPRWVEFLGLGEVVLRGINLKWHDEAENYRSVIEFIKNDPLSLGALVTTHKLDLLHACRDQFDQLDEFATLMQELSSISKRDGKLVGHAKDPITSGLSLEALLPERHWQKSGAEALVLGAGGSAIAVTWHLLKGGEQGVHRSTRIVVTNRSRPRLDEIRAIHTKIGADIPMEYCHTPEAEMNEPILVGLKPGSLVINATGLGKDAPGSPLTGDAVWPENGIAWDFNYRGDLVFLDQARRQQAEKNLQVEDGWIYFIHGWTRVIAEVFDVDIPTSGPTLNELSRIAAAVRT